MLFIGGIIAIVVFTIQVFKTAKGTGRNAGLWAALTAAIGIGFQFFVPLILGIIIAVYYLATGSSPETLERDVQMPATVIGVISIIVSIIGMVLVSKHVSKVVDVPVGSREVPPPPPSF